MSIVHIKFPSPPKRLSSPDANCVDVDCAVLDDSEASNGDIDPAQPTVDPQVVESLSAIANRLTQLQGALASERQRLGQQVVQAATEVARAVLRDQELVQQRVVQFVQIATEQIDSNHHQTALVHPSCVDAVQSWLDESEAKSLHVIGDDTVSPGDCRIDCGDRGVTATLDAFLAALIDQAQATT